MHEGLVNRNELLHNNTADLKIIMLSVRAKYKKEYDSGYIKLSKNSNQCIMTEGRWVVAWDRVSEVGCSLSNCGNGFRTCPYMHTYKIVCFKYGQFIMCQLNLNSAVNIH